jgi:hypothetical protein
MQKLALLYFTLAAVYVFGLHYQNNLALNESPIPAELEQMYPPDPTPAQIRAQEDSILAAYLREAVRPNRYTLPHNPLTLRQLQAPAGATGAQLMALMFGTQRFQLDSNRTYTIWHHPQAIGLWRHYSDTEEAGVVHRDSVYFQRFDQGLDGAWAAATVLLADTVIRQNGRVYHALAVATRGFADTTYSGWYLGRFSRHIVGLALFEQVGSQLQLRYWQHELLGVGIFGMVGNGRWLYDGQQLLYLQHNIWQAMGTPITAYELVVRAQKDSAQVLGHIPLRYGVFMEETGEYETPIAYSCDYTFVAGQLRFVCTGAFNSKHPMIKDSYNKTEFIDRANDLHPDILKQPRLQFKLTTRGYYTLTPDSLRRDRNLLQVLPFHPSPKRQYPPS